MVYLAILLVAYFRDISNCPKLSDLQIANQKVMSNHVVYEQYPKQARPFRRKIPSLSSLSSENAPTGITSSATATCFNQCKTDLQTPFISFNRKELTLDGDLSHNDGRIHL